MAEERITIPEAEKLSNPKNTIAVVQGHSFTFRKNFGQNFLIDSHVFGIDSEPDGTVVRRPVGVSVAVIIGYAHGQETLLRRIVQRIGGKTCRIS